MKYYLVAGEASGDMHAANLMKAIKKNDSNAEFRCFGGDLMQAERGRLSVHYREMALMGGLEVLGHLSVIRRNREICRRDILDFNPDVLILVDYSGFNVPMAKFAKKNGLKVFYYISPKLWAWAKWRVKSIKLYVDKMFAILPSEVDFYRTHGIDAEYYGNPVLDSVDNFLREKENIPGLPQTSDHRPVVSLLAGSRGQEIDKLLPEMLSVVRLYPEYRFVIAGAPSITPEFYGKYTSGVDVDIVYNQTYKLLLASYAAVVTSGTATLETALLNVPEVVVYKTSGFNFFVGSFFVKIKFFSLVNLILDREAVKELLQENLGTDIKKELDKLLYDQHYRAVMLDNYTQLRRTLGHPGVSERAAARISQLLK